MGKNNLFKPYRSFLKAIGDYGIYCEVSKKHMHLLKDGKLVSSMSLTPGDKHVAIDHTLRYLISNGHLPKVNRKSYVAELKKAKV